MRRVLALTLPVAATAGTYTVGLTGDHATLQAAIDAAVEGDVFPSAPEIANDGIDQDCDGVDLRDDTGETDDGGVGERGSCGCGAVSPSASWFLVLPVLVWIRRRPEAGTR